MDAEMQTTIVIVWLAGVVCGTAFFTGVGAFLYFLWKKQITRLIFPVLAVVLGFSGMSYSLFTLLQLVRTWVEN